MFFIYIFAFRLIKQAYQLAIYLLIDCFWAKLIDHRKLVQAIKNFFEGRRIQTAQKATIVLKLF